MLTVALMLIPGKIERTSPKCALLDAGEEEALAAPRGDHTRTVTVDRTV
jgi:hypothetical protein